MGLIVAFDKGGVDEAAALVGKLCGVVDGFKVGVPFLLANGAASAGALREKCPSALWVADLKLADIGYVMGLTASIVAPFFDAVIAHGFVGYEGGLDELKRLLDEKDRKLIVVASMSHPGAAKTYDKVLGEVLEAIEAAKPWGVVAPATRPSIIRLVRERLGNTVKILAPGVGAQGARPGEALCAGADYEIVGRAITGSENPVEAARRIIEEQRKTLSSCRGAGQP
ncbi:orotidine-5'-phosphate decarboxylase [Pyrofollis japonicus]|nr:orotidine-5'-phosphate decarboxylase [Pyrofollis japonicus]